MSCVVFWQLLLIYKSITRRVLPSFKSVGLSVQEKKRKIDFQDSCHDGHFRFWSERLKLYIFFMWLQSFLPSFVSIGPVCRRSRLLKQTVDIARRTTLLFDLMTYFLTPHDPISNLTDILSRTSLWESLKLRLKTWPVECLLAILTIKGI